MIPFDPSLGARRYLLPAALLRSGAQCRAILKEQGAQVAVGMGGYPSAPVIVGARMAGVPSLIHESNAVPGRANKFAARLTPHLALAFDRSRRPSGGRRAGRDRGHAAGRAAGRAGPRGAAGGRPAGAGRAGRGAAAAGQRREPGRGPAHRGRGGAGRPGYRSRTDLRLLIKTGPAALEETRALLAANGGAAVAEAVPYLDRMDLAYAAADLVVCRAGSATVAELATIGMPAVLVPYPHAPGDHQTHNARVLVRRRGALLLPDAGDLGASGWTSWSPRCSTIPARLAAMGAAADPGTHARAADLLAAEALALAGVTPSPPTTSRPHTTTKESA